MKQLALMMLFMTLLLPGSASAQQERRNLVRVPVIDDINPTYSGKWGWHKVHKKTVRKTVRAIQRSSSIPKKDICSRCHIKKGYKIFDPHTQLTEKGEIIKEKCLYCHPEKPDEKNADFASDPSDIKFVRDLQVLCLGCHSKQYNSGHPVNAKHICKPSGEMQKMMKESEEQFGIVLPLSFDGEIMCATCHNPHERGVIPNEKSASKGASEKYRVRLIGLTTKSREQEVGPMVLLTDRGERPEVNKVARFRVPLTDHYENGAELQENEESMYSKGSEVIKICLTCHKNKSDSDFSRQ